MLTNKLYSFGDFKNAIKESANDFKPVYDKNVARDDKRNNEKAVNDIMRQTKSYDRKGKLNKGKILNDSDNSYDQNKTTLDYDYAFEPSDDYRDRVKSQVHGYASQESEKKLAKGKTADDNGNKDFYKSRKTKNKKQSETEKNDKAAGLKARELDKKNFKSKTAFKNESKDRYKMSILHFKNTVFTNEEKMLKKVPDAYKTDGNKFVMMDAAKTQYLIECKVDDRFHFAQLNILAKFNADTINEELDRMRELSSYKSSDYFTSASAKQRAEEDTKFGKLVESIRQMEEEVKIKKK